MSEHPIPRLVYVLPRYDPAASSHFFHLYELIGGAAGLLDFLVVVEQAKGDPRELGVRAYVQRFFWPPLRFLELTLVLMYERMRGCRYFYTHYSFYGAAASWLVTRLLGGTAYYWNCGMPWLYRRPWLEERIFRFILRHTVFVTGTPGIAGEYCRRYGIRPERTRVMPNWVSIARFSSSEYSYDRKNIREELGIPIDAKVVLFVHRLSRRKGAHILPEIIAGVIRLGSNASADSAKRGKDAMFVIVGDGPEGESLKLKIKSLKLEPYVRMVGEVPHRELPAYYRAADVFLMPSEEEGFPHVLLEAMAAGVPFVASNVGGVREITPPELQSFLVTCGDVPVFAIKLLELLAMQEPEREQVNAAEQEWVKQYDLHAVLPKFIALFKNRIQE